MIFFRKKQFKVYKPALFLQELERRIVLDASFDPTLHDDSIQHIDYRQNLAIDAVRAEHGPLGRLPGAETTLHKKDLNVVLVSDSISGLEGIKRAASEDAHLIVYNGHEDNLETVNRKLIDLQDSQGRKIGSLALLAHSEKGVLMIGTDRIDLANVQAYRPQIEMLGRNFAEHGQIQLYGCSLAGDIYGQGLVEVISVYSHTDVFASVNKTGSGPGNDWTLEYTTNPQAAVQTLLNTEQSTDLPFELALGDVFITKGTIAPVVQGTTDVNLNGAFAVSNKEGSLITTVTVLANPSSTNGWNTISVDKPFAESFSGVTVTGNGTEKITISGAFAGQATAVLGTLQGTLNPSFSGNSQILIYAQDTDKDWASDTLAVTVTPAPPVDPVIDFPPAVPVNPNITTPITGISISDLDAGSSGLLTITLSASHGTLTVQVPATPPGTTPTVYTNANVTFTDTLTNVNTALAGLKYTPTSGYTGTDPLFITAVDQSTPTPGSDTATVVINVAAITFADPVVTPPATSPTVDPNVTSPITGISVTDADIGTTGQLTITLSVSHGTLTVQVPATTPGATPTTYTNANVTFTDTLTNVNTALAGLKYTPTSGFGGATDTLNITAVDQNLGSSGTVPITINVAAITFADPVVHPPVPPPVNPNVTTPITGISVTDADIGTTGQLTVTLSVSHGTLTVQVPATTPGATPTTYTNANVTFTDTLTNVNTALEGLKYTPTSGFSGAADILNITAVDQNLGSSGTVPITINVAAIKYADPVIHPPVPPPVNPNVTTPITGISVTDADMEPLVSSRLPCRFHMGR